MVSSKAAAGDGDTGIAGLVADSGQDFFQQETIIEGMMPGPLPRGDRFVIPAPGIDAIRAIDLYLSAFEEPVGCPDQSLVLVLVIGALGGRE
jgi:hypothetical protein